VRRVGREVEIKLRVTDLRELRGKLKRLGATVKIGRVYERNELWDTPRWDLMSREQLLRIRSESRSPGARKHGARSESGRTLLTFKGPEDGSVPKEAAGAAMAQYKVREEIEVQVQGPRSLEKIFKMLGMRVWFRYEKYRTTYHLPRAKRWARGLLIDLDETPMGVFVELEGPARAIDRVAKSLGYSRTDYITATYYVLYRDACRRAGKKAGDMFFAGR
jgi:adenylate cyclase, class 2